MEEERIYVSAAAVTGYHTHVKQDAGRFVRIVEEMIDATRRIKQQVDEILGRWQAMLHRTSNCIARCQSRKAALITEQRSVEQELQYLLSHPRVEYRTDCYGNTQKTEVFDTAKIAALRQRSLEIETKIRRIDATLHSGESLKEDCLRALDTLHHVVHEMTGAIEAFTACAQKSRNTLDGINGTLLRVLECVQSYEALPSFGTYEPASKSELEFFPKRPVLFGG